MVKRAEVKGFDAGKEYHRKTRRLNEMWSTDCSYFRVVGWGYYYLVTVMGDYSRYILGWKDGILARRKEAKRETLQARKEYNQKLRELDRGNSTG